MHLGARSPVLEPCVPNRSLSRPICGERRTKPNPSVHRRPSVVRQRRRDGCTAEGQHSESRGTVPIFSGSEKVQAWAMACVQLAWVLGGLVIPAGDWRAGGPLGSGWCFLLIRQTPFLTLTSPRESHSGEGGDSRGRARGLDLHRGRLRGRALGVLQPSGCYTVRCDGDVGARGP